MNKKELIVKIAERMTTEEKKVTQKAAGEYLDAITEVVMEALSEGVEVKISGFGTFSVTERAAREGRNPMTGETIQIEAKKSPKFKAAKALKEAVNA